MAISSNTTGLRPGVCLSTSRPSSPYEGQMIYETDTDLTYVWGGSAWQQVSGGTAVGNSGLVYIASTVVGTAVSTATVNNCFSATYDTYRVVYSGGIGSANTGLGVRVGGSTANYSHMLFWQTPGVGGVNSDSSTNTSQVNYIGSCTTSSATLTVDITNPFISTLHTTFSGGAYLANDFGISVGRHNIAQSNTSVTVLSLSGTITGGTITVYGYRK